MPHMLYKKINDNFQPTIQKAFGELKEKGYSIFHVGDFSKEDFLNFSYSFGEVIPSGREKGLVDEIYISGELKQSSLPLHTDKSYWRIPPSFEILYVNDVHNMQHGEIIVGDLLKSFKQLSEDEQKQLLGFSGIYKSPKNRDAGEINVKLVGKIDDELAFFRYRLDLFDSSAPVIEKWNKEIEKTLVLVPYRKGDILILDNRLHCAGRNITTWSEGGFRHLYRTLVM